MTFDGDPHWLTHWCCSRHFCVSDARWVDACCGAIMCYAQ